MQANYYQGGEIGREFEGWVPFKLAKSQSYQEIELPTTYPSFWEIRRIILERYVMSML
jgi:hypothetical protein